MFNFQTSLPQINPSLGIMTGIANAQSLYGQYLRNQTANAQQQLANQTLPSTISATNATNQAKTMTAIPGAQAQLATDQLKSNYPLLGTTGMAGQAGAVQYLQKTDPKTADMLSGLLLNQNALGRARMISAMPVDQRNKFFAIAAGMGYDPQQSLQALESGMTLQDLANTKGKNLADVQANYAPTTATRTQLQKQVQAGSGLSYLNNVISDGASQYAGIWPHVTSEWYRDAVSNDPTRQQNAAKYYTAMAIAPEISGIRMRMQNGQAGIEAIREMTKSAIGNIPSSLQYTSPTVYAATQKGIQDALDGAVNAESQQTTGQNPNQLNAVPASGSGMVTVVNSQGDRYQIPAKNLNEAMKRGFKEEG